MKWFMGQEVARLRAQLAAKEKELARAQADVAMMEQWVKKANDRERALCGACKPVRMPEPELRAALAVPAEHPLWQAVRTILDRVIDDAHEGVCGPTNEAQVIQLTAYAGACEFARSFRATLEEARMAALRAQQGES